jgi:hypothetical protein
MFVWLRGQGFESSVNKVFQKEKLVNSKTIKDLQSSKRKLVQQELTWFNIYAHSMPVKFTPRSAVGYTFWLQFDCKSYLKMIKHL